MCKFTLILLAACLSLPAADDVQGQAGSQRATIRERVLQRFDTDHDGKLSDSEKAAARAAFAERLKKNHPEVFKKIDRNGDGVLSQDEMKAAREKMGEHRGEIAAKIKEKHPELFKKIDTNGDGQLSRAELQAFRAQRQADKGGK